VKNILPLILGGAALFAFSRARASGAQTKTGAAGINLIKEFEGFRATPYPDGDGVLAIGYGTTNKSDVPSYLFNGQPITENQATELLKQHLRTSVEPAIARLVNVPLYQNEYDALSSLIYNIGEGNFANSTVRRQLNAGNKQEAAFAFSMWNKAGGKVIEGLNRRRAAERSLFLRNSGVGS
jgi:lysozyme